MQHLAMTSASTGSPRSLPATRLLAILWGFLLTILAAGHAHAAGGSCRDDSYCITGFSCQAVRKPCVADPTGKACIARQCLPASPPAPKPGQPTEARLSCAADKTRGVVFDVYAPSKHVRVAISGRHWFYLLQGAPDAPLPPEMVTVCEETACRLVGGAIKLVVPASDRPGSPLAGYLYVNDPEGAGVIPFRAMVSPNDQPLVCG